MRTAFFERSRPAESFIFIGAPSPARRVFQVVFQPLRLSPG
jgi:hypothetical protein